MNYRNAGLDVLRAVAITLVLLRHSPLPPEDSVFFPLLAVVHCGGWVGVDLFFVLSGFLVSGLLFAEFKERGEARVGRFLVRRGFKIYPAFWMHLVFWMVYLQLTETPWRKLRLAGELLFLQNYVGRLQPITWSLAVEEHFYFLLALIFWLALRRGRLARLNAKDPFRFIPALFVTMAAGCFVSRLLAALWIGQVSGKWLTFGSHVRIDSLMAGVLLSYCLHFRLDPEAVVRLKRYRWPLIAAGAACFIPAFIWSFETYLWVPVAGYPLFALGGVLLVAGAVAATSEGTSRLVRCCAFGGSHSYSVYLWHYTVLTLLVPVLDRSGVAWWVGWGGYFLAAWAVGIVMASVIEFPVLRLRDRLLGGGRPLSLKALDGHLGVAENRIPRILAKSATQHEQKQN